MTSFLSSFFPKTDPIKSSWLILPSDLVTKKGSLLNAKALNKENGLRRRNVRAVFLIILSA